MRWLVAAALAALALPASALELSHVRHAPAVLEPGKGPVAVHFRISEPASVVLGIFDGRNVRVRSVASKGVLPAGDRQLEWDGRDFAGRPVPPEAYVYTLVATGADGKAVEWDLTDLTGGEAFEPTDLSWDPKRGVVSYRLHEAARVRVRIGLARQGPLLRTLVDWLARAPGAHAEPWDGMDASGALALGAHPELELRAEAFTLSANTILVTRAPPAVALIDDVPKPWVRRAVKGTHRRRMFDYARQPIQTRRDYVAHLALADDAGRTADGLPIVRGPVGVRVSVDPALLRPVLDERCEAVFYVDGRVAFENQVSFLPMTWRWDPHGAPGVHYLTANLQGYEGHFGVQTLEVWVAPQEETP